MLSSKSKSFRSFNIRSLMLSKDSSSSSIRLFKLKAHLLDAFWLFSILLKFLAKLFPNTLEVVAFRCTGVTHKFDWKENLIGLIFRNGKYFSVTVFYPMTIIPLVYPKSFRPVSRVWCRWNVVLMLLKAQDDQMVSDSHHDPKYPNRLLTMNDATFGHFC